MKASTFSTERTTHFRSKKTFEKPPPQRSEDKRLSKNVYLHLLPLNCD